MHAFESRTPSTRVLFEMVISIKIIMEEFILKTTKILATRIVI